MPKEASRMNEKWISICYWKVSADIAKCFSITLFPKWKRKSFLADCTFISPLHVVFL